MNKRFLSTIVALLLSIITVVSVMPLSMATGVVDKAVKDQTVSVVHTEEQKQESRKMPIKEQFGKIFIVAVIIGLLAVAYGVSSQLYNQRKMDEFRENAKKPIENDPRKKGDKSEDD